MPRFIAKLKLPALLLLIAVAFNWKLTLTGQYTCLESPDIVIQVMPWLQVQAAQWHEHRFPTWDPHQWAGQPLIGQVQPGTLNPLNWILFSMPLKDGLIQLPVLHWYWVLIQFLGVLFCYWLCRDVGLSETAAVLGGCAFGLGGFIGTIGWPQKMMSAVLLPLILLFFLRVLRGQRPLSNAAISGALLGASFLTGHHNVPFLFTLAMLGLWIYYFVAQRSFQWKTIAPAAAFFACFALIAAAQILPAIELGRLSLRWVGAPNPLRWGDNVPYNVQEDFSLSPSAIASMVLRGFTDLAGLFVGVVVVALALIAAAVARKDRTVRLLAAIALAGLLISLGGNSLFHGILYAVIPGLDKVRTPYNAAAIFGLGMAVLAAYGLDSFRTASLGASMDRHAIRLLALSSLFLYGVVIVLKVVQPDKREQLNYLAQTALVALFAAGIFAAWSRSWLSDRAGRVLLILLLLFELNPVTTYGYHSFEATPLLRKLYEHRDLAAFLKQQPDLPRVEIDEKEIPYNFGDWFGIDQFEGNLAGVVKSIADVQGETRWRMLLSATHYIGRTPSRPDQRLVFEGEHGLKIFANPAALARARIVHAVTNNPANADLERTVSLEGQTPPLETCEGGSAHIERYRPSSIAVRTDAPCKSMLLIADTWFPGWEASVDGKAAEIWKAYGVMRGVVVDRGQHEVKMVYRPASVYTGAGLAVLGMLLTIVLRFKPSILEIPPGR